MHTSLMSQYVQVVERAYELFQTKSPTCCVHGLLILSSVLERSLGDVSSVLNLSMTQYFTSYYDIDILNKIFLVDTFQNDTYLSTGFMLRICVVTINCIYTDRYI